MNVPSAAWINVLILFRRGIDVPPIKWPVLSYLSTRYLVALLASGN